jgi:hypothetical protein
VVADQIVSGRAKESTAALLTSGTEKPMGILEPTHTEAVLVTATALHRQIKAERTALSCTRGKRLEGLPDARRSRRRT